MKRFLKGKRNRLFKEVDDSRQIVNDFRRRSNQLFENYRAVSYKKEPLYDLEKLKNENAEVLAKLIASHAIDAGNEDCLVDKILGPVRGGLRYLDDQALEHKDFYIRQEGNMKSHKMDVRRIRAFWEEKLMQMEKEHEHTVRLWDKNCGYSIKEETKDEER